MSRPQTVARSWGNRWGELMARRARTVLAIAVVALIACGLGYMTIARYLPPADVSVTGSESARTADLMHRYFPAVGGESDLIVFSSPDRTVDDPAFRTRIDGTVRAASQHAGVAAASGPFDMFNPLAARAISPDRHAALAVLRLSADDAHQRARDADALRPVISGHSGDGIEVGLTGYSPATNDLASTEKADTARAEAIGLPVALILLILSFGAAMAAVLPLVVAGIGLVCTFGVIAALMPAMNFSALVVTIATTLGTGLAIDYALFVVSRFREELARRSITDAADREAVAEAVGAALTTAGRTITISGLIVLVTLSCLAVVNSPVFREITVGISATVVCLLIVALTALPALLGLLGPRVSRWSLPNWANPADARLGSEIPRGRWSAWARNVMARPVRYGVAAVAILAVGLIPLGSLRYGLNLGGDALAHTDSGRANTVLAQRFTPGLSGPIQVVVTGKDGAADDPAAVSRLTGRFATDNRVWAQLSQQAEGRQALVIVPAVAPDSAAAIDLVRDLRAAGADA
ncbi:MAG: MMPL family transporter, partial [Nocardia sp.]|nr:MMPL family transporter [Nocardia sp.]